MRIFIKFSDVEILAVRIIGTSFLDQFPDKLTTRKYDNRSLSELQREDGPILLRPFLIGQVYVLLG